MVEAALFSFIFISAIVLIFLIGVTATYDD